MAATGLVFSNLIQIVNFIACVTLKFDGWPRKTIGHFFYTTSSFVHHLKSIGEFKLELKSGNVQFGWKLAIFCPVRPWNLMDDLGKQYGASSILHQALCIISNPSVNLNLSYDPETLNFGGKLVIFFLSRVTLKSDGWSWKTKGHLFYITLNFKAIISKPWVKANWSYSPETINSGQNRHFFPRVTLKFDRWPWKTIGHLSTYPMLLQALCVIS